MSKMARTPSSYQARAMDRPTSGLLVWSPLSSWIGRPSTEPPKSSTAMVAAVNDPMPE